MLERTLAETDPDTTDVVVMTAHVTQRGGEGMPAMALDHYDRELMTAVVDRAEKAGKQVHPMILRTNNPLFAVVNTAADIRAHELIMGVSNVYSANEQIEQIAFYWINIHGGEPTPLTVRLLSPSRDVYFDLAGGNRIPKLGERTGTFRRGTSRRRRRCAPRSLGALRHAGKQRPLLRRPHHA